MGPCASALLPLPWACRRECAPLFLQHQAWVEPRVLPAPCPFPKAGWLKGSLSPSWRPEVRNEGVARALLPLRLQGWVPLPLPVSEHLQVPLGSWLTATHSASKVTQPFLFHPL